MGPEAVLEASWASGGLLGRSRERFGGVLGRLGVLWNAEERLTMLACV